MSSTYVFARRFDLGQAPVRGVGFDPYDIAKRGAKLDSDVGVLDEVITADRHAMAAKLAAYDKSNSLSGGAMPIYSSETGLVFPPIDSPNYADIILKDIPKFNKNGTLWEDPLTAAERARVQWMPNWFAFVMDWNQAKGKGFDSFDSSDLRKFELDYRTLRSQWEALPGAPHPKTPLKPLDEEPSIWPEIPWKLVGGVILLGAAVWIGTPLLIAAFAAKA